MNIYQEKDGENLQEEEDDEIKQRNHPFIN